MTNPNHELIMTQQQVIHYRSEVFKYKNRIVELELQIEKEVVRNKYLQNKLRELNNQKIANYIQEIKQLKKMVLQLEVQLEEERLFMEGNQVLVEHELPASNEKEEGLLDFYSYFNYSIILPSDEESIISIYGDLTVVNSGEKELEDVVVCLKVKPIGKVLLSGKISNPKQIQQDNQQRQAVDWIYAIEDYKEKIRKDGEYWIRTVKKPKLGKQESLTFKGFEISIEKQNNLRNFAVESFIYSDLNSTGRAGKNKILINLL